MNQIDSEFHELHLTGKHDSLYSGSSYPKPFEFNAEVADVFDSMAIRSIPLYRETIEALANWGEVNAFVPGKVFDIGCSTGTTILALGQRLSQSRRFVGVDKSAPMLAKAKEKLSLMPERHRVDLMEADALDLDFCDGSIVIMNYTLQFLESSKKIEIVAKIYNGLNKGGVFFLSEKIKSSSPQVQGIMTEIYESFKRQNGYSSNEIERKKEALEKVLVPLTPDEHLNVLRGAGFTACEPVLRWNNFVTYVAIK